MLLSVGPELSIPSIIVALTNLAVTLFFRLNLKQPLQGIEAAWHCCIQMDDYPPSEPDVIRFVNTVHMAIRELA